jgi:hypothetical protein
VLEVSVGDLVAMPVARGGPPAEARAASSDAARAQSPPPRSDLRAVEGQEASRADLNPQEKMPSASATAPATAPSVEPAKAPSERGARVALEVALLEQARRALSDGHATEAQRVLTRYRRECPLLVLEEEASVLEMESLALDGQQALAGTKASAFLVAHPTSALAPRARRVLRAALSP